MDSEVHRASFSISYNSAVLSLIRSTVSLLNFCRRLAGWLSRDPSDLLMLRKTTFGNCPGLYSFKQGCAVICYMRWVLYQDVSFHHLNGSLPNFSQATSFLLGKKNHCSAGTLSRALTASKLNSSSERRLQHWTWAAHAPNQAQGYKVRSFPVGFDIGIKRQAELYLKVLKSKQVHRSAERVREPHLKVCWGCWKGRCRKEGEKGTVTWKKT